MEVMPPRKQLHSIKENAEKANEAHGSGSQSRIGLDFDKLRKLAGESQRRNDHLRQRFTFGTERQ